MIPNMARNRERGVIERFQEQGEISNRILRETKGRGSEKKDRQTMIWCLRMHYIRFNLWPVWRSGNLYELVCRRRSGFTTETRFGY